MKRFSMLASGSLVSALMFGTHLLAEPVATTTLRDAAPESMLIGAAIMSNHLVDPKLSPLIARQFNSLTGENEFKPTSLQNERGKFTFEAADKIAAFAKTHDLKLIGHTLLWHNQSPRWMFETPDGKPLPREVALENLRQHITTVVTHFKGSVVGWDVVNEAIPDSPGDLRDTPALKAIGEDYIEKAFEFAHAADPDVELYYNDYNIEQPYKFDRAMKLLRKLKESGVRIDGVGVQGHWGLGQDAKQVDDAIRQFQSLGLKVMITELDVDVIPKKQTGADVTATEAAGADPYKAGLPDDVQAKLAKTYADLFQVFKERGVTRVTFWGTHDGTSWLNDWPVRGRTNHALLFDRQLQPKPAFEAVIKALKAPTTQPVAAH